MTMEIDAIIGEKILERRRLIGLSQDQLAKAMRERGHAWRQNTQSKVEVGERPVKLSEARDLADLLMCPMDYFTGTAPANDVDGGLTLAIEHLLAYRANMREMAF